MSVLELDNLTSIDGVVVSDCSSQSLKEINIPSLMDIISSTISPYKQTLVANCNYVEKISIDNANMITGYGTKFVARNCPRLKEVIMKSFSIFHSNSNGLGGIIGEGCENIRKIIIGTTTDFSPKYIFQKYNNSGAKWYPNLIHFEIGNESKEELNFLVWFPITAISTDSNNLIEDDFCLNNAEQFLFNFRTYIINRLKNFSSSTKKYLYFYSQITNFVFGIDTNEYANSYHMPIIDEQGHKIGEEEIDYVTSLNQKLSDINWGIGNA